MARVALLCADLLFGSKVEGGLSAAGHEVVRFESAEDAPGALSQAQVLVADLASPEPDGLSIFTTLRDYGLLAGVATLGFYSHVDQDTRRRAEEAGFDSVVPRSRMAREMATLVERLAVA